MNSEQLTALAAAATVVISLVNVGLSSFLLRRQESERWTREQLPNLVQKFSDSTHTYYVKIFNGDRSTIDPSSRGDHGMEEFREVMAALKRLEVFASPAVISAASEVTLWIEAMRQHYLTALEQGQEAIEEPWDLYWHYAEARHSFLVASRKEMGLRRPPVPPGLQSHRQQAMPDQRRTWFRRSSQSVATRSDSSSGDS
ncbi:hypothetical protein [Streptomyces hirsutus]|uniref:hypothetical protein n=1 Tax=Streptomyces hirsutus TaxID=35620 RepID=UPI0036742799